MFLSGKEVFLSNADSKGIYKEIRDGEIVQPTAQKKYVKFFENDDLNWKEIYSLFLEHLFVSCLITQSFWAEVIKWCSNRGVVINHLSAKDILFGIKVHKDNLFLNHILLVGKQYTYN